jgi:hypothetical protein
VQQGWETAAAAEDFSSTLFRGGRARKMDGFRRSRPRKAEAAAEDRGRREFKIEINIYLYY